MAAIDDVLERLDHGLSAFGVGWVAYVEQVRVARQMALARSHLWNL